MSSKKSPNLDLGQHFLVDRKYLSVISAPISKTDIVLEVGSGNGILTESLAQKAKRVIATEIDKNFKSTLKNLARKYKNIEPVFTDVLSTKFEKVNYIVSNMPYHITEPFLNKVIVYKKIKMRLMVGGKLAHLAQIKDPSDPDFTELSLLCKSFYVVKEIAAVPKSAFRPEPRTNSAILEFIPKTIDEIQDKGGFIAQKLFLSQKKGSKLKNFLMNALIFSDKKLTKNEAREEISKLGLPGEVLEKSFSQLNNSEVRALATKLDRLSHFVK